MSSKRKIQTIYRINEKLEVWEEEIFEIVWKNFRFFSAIKCSEIQPESCMFRSLFEQLTCSMATDRGIGVVKGLNKGSDFK